MPISTFIPLTFARVIFSPFPRHNSLKKKTHRILKQYMTKHIEPRINQLIRLREFITTDINGSRGRLLQITPAPFESTSSPYGRLGMTRF